LKRATCPNAGLELSSVAALLCARNEGFLSPFMRAAADKKGGGGSEERKKNREKPREEKAFNKSFQPIS